jgi:Domain of unknown function (DUF3472)/Domain of unknown function (DUF5077)
MNNKLLFLPLLVTLMAVVLFGQQSGTKQAVPVGGNSWISKHSKLGNEKVTQNGWSLWTESDTVFSTYINLAKPGKLTVFAELASPGKDTIKISVNGISKTLTYSGAKREYTLGEWQITKAGYTRIDINGVTRSGPAFPVIKELLIAGSAVDTDTAFVKNNEGNYFYWGRRGPSVHLRHDVAQIGGDIEYFYSEITVPKGNDVIGSYYMANGFDGGYFGMQVNSPTERRVLFSVWSPFKTDDPKKIPEDQKIVLLKKGKDVYTGEFGNEGSGGQSYLKYNWKAGNAYKFLLRGQPVRNNYTNYTAWFYAPEEGTWRLIASFSRPATKSYLKGLYSFLENFMPETGNITRKAWYHNQWARTSDQKWVPITKVQFTYDATAKKGYRLDYGGGVEDGKFYLRNCGFFNDNTAFQSVFTHSITTSPPAIDLSKLE